MEWHPNGGPSKAGRMRDLTWDPGDPASNATYFCLLAGGPACRRYLNGLSRLPLTYSYSRWLGAAEKLQQR